MSSNDVRSIMGLASTSGASTSTSHHKGTRVSTRKPEGISRELYALIGANAPSLQAAQLEHQTLKFKERPKLKRKAVKWEWKSFAPANRTGLQLAHWVKASDEGAEDPFSKYNSTTPVMDFSQQEYDTSLRDEDWSQNETSYLFSLLREYDLRFVIVADRYAYPGDLGTEFLDLPEGGRKRTIEDIKSRYYSICRRLVRSRPTGDEQGKTTMLQYYAFDKERELARKNYASSLFHLTPSQIAEEEALYLECKRMEQQEKKFKADREDLMRMLAGFESGLIGLPGKAGGAAGAGVGEVGGDKKRKDVLGLDGPTGAMSSKKAEKNAKQDLLHCIHRLPLPQPSALSGHTLKSSSGPPTLPNLPVYLRSTRLPVPSKPSLTQPVLALLSELTPPVPLPGKLVMPTRGSLERLEGLMAASQGLVEMKRNVDRVEQEVRILKARVEAKRVEDERERGGEGGAMEGVEEAAGAVVEPRKEGEGLVDAGGEADAAGEEIDVDAAGEEVEEAKEKVEKEGDASVESAETAAAGEASTSTEAVPNP